MLYGFLTFIYILVSIFLILVVLLQTGKRADLAGAFGGGGSQTAFGARGAATLLTKLTTVSAVLFMVLALTLSLLAGGGGRRGSILDEVADEGSTTPLSAPAQLPVDSLPGQEADAVDDTDTDGDADADTGTGSIPSTP